MFRPGKKIKLLPYSSDSWQYLAKWFYSGDFPLFFRNHIYKKSQTELENFESLYQIQGFLIFFEDRPIGFATLSFVNYISRSAHIGILIEKEYSKQDLAADAFAVLSDYIFNRLNFHKMSAQVSSVDKRSIHILETAGLTLEAKIKDASFINGMYNDDLIYSIFDTEMKQILRIYFGD